MERRESKQKKNKYKKTKQKAAINGRNKATNELQKKKQTETRAKRGRNVLSIKA